MTTELATRENGAVAEVAGPSSGLALSFAEMTMRVAQVDQFYRQVMQAGTDYGVIPGTDKPTLYQPGAQMLDQIFGYSPRFEILPSSVIDWQRPIPFFHYVILCRLISLRSGETVAEGIGSCNSYEDKYRWRNAKRVCPQCKAEAITKGRQEYGGGWLCFKRTGGCGAKFRDGDAAIENQTAGRVANEDTASLENTVSKMAQKRAHIAATLNATGASRIFTQDIEDLPQFQEAIRQATVVQSSSAPVEQDERRTVGDNVRERAAARTVEVDGRVVKSNDAPPVEPPVEPPASVEDRVRFDAQWKKGCERAISCGVAPDDAPPADATNADLNRAGREFLEAITARERLNAALVERITLANQHGATFPMPEPSKMTDQEVHDQIATCDRVLDAAEQSDDSEAF